MADSDAASKPPKEKKVKVVYNGRTEQFPYGPETLVGALLAQANATFQIVQNQHLFALHDKEGNELVDSATLSAADIEHGDKLVLRQSAVRGG